MPNVENRPDFVSSASFVDFQTIIDGIKGGEQRDKAIEGMFVWTQSRGFKPEIMLFPWMVGNREPFKKKLEELGITGPFAFHLPKDHGWSVGEIGEGLSCLGHGDFKGSLFFSPLRLGTISPASVFHYVQFLNQLFNRKDGFSPEECLAITVHDGTIMERTGGREGPLTLNEVGREFVKRAKAGYKVGVELAFEGSRLPVGCPRTYIFEDFLQLCKKSHFGLTLDTHNLWQIVTQSDGNFEYFPRFMISIIRACRQTGVPVYMIHFNPFSIEKKGAHLNPSFSSISLGWLRSFMEVNGLADIPISLETYGEALANGLDLEETPNQQMLQAILRPFV